MDAIRGVEIRTPCGHYYDKGCMLQLFEAATKDESLFPPRCCRMPIPLASVSVYLTSAAVKTFEEKSVEFGTRKRVYCAKPSCSRFLGAQHERSWRPSSYRCPAPGCNTLTCSSCKNIMKTNAIHRCDTNESDRNVLALGQQSGWARCPGCETMIELNLGCYHMTCRCRTEFCYLCKARWKTCECPQWDEHRLFVAAEARADAELQVRVGGVGRHAAPALPPRPAPAPAPAPLRVAPAPIPAPGPAPARSHAFVIQASARASVLRGEADRQVPPHDHQSSPYRPESRLTARGISALQDSAFRPRGPITSQGTPAATSTAAPSSRRPISLISVSSSDSEGSPSGTSPGSRASTKPTTRAPLVSFPHRSSVRQDAPSLKGKEREQAPTGKPERDALVRKWMDHLRVNHDCDHGSWTSRRGAGTCDVCHDRLPVYLFRCNGCQTMACRRCRWNRL
ncbi:hypothetical protein C8Q74DRAFT_1047656 [Fomes fomentarius]|nr:hypothetical protein C8Q74DRAFT_1047656 [Fomes fomentarius]